MVFAEAGDGVDLVVHVSGDRGLPPVLQLSGGPGHSAYLAATSWTDPAFVVTPEPRSDPHDLDQAMADIEAVRGHLGIESWAVIGHSWGADLGLAYALAYPLVVTRLVHVCGTGLQNDREWSAAYHAGAAGRPSAPLPGAFRPEVHAALTASWRQWIKRPGLWREVAACAVPVSVVVAGDDIRPAWPNHQLAEALPHSEFRVVPHVDHDFWRDAPEAWRDAVQRPWLATAAAASAAASGSRYRPPRVTGRKSSSSS